MKIQNYIDSEKEKGLTYDEIVHKTKQKMARVERKRNTIIEIKKELDAQPADYQLWKWTRIVSEKLADPTKTTTKKTLCNNLTWVHSAEEAAFLMDICK